MSQGIITMLYRILQQLGGGAVAGQLPASIDKITRVVAFSTTTPLGAAGVYTSPTIDGLNYKTTSLTTLSDQVGGWVAQHSNDGVTWVSTASTATVANTLANNAVILVRRYIRVVYTNGATPQGSFDAALYLSPL